MEVMRWRAAVVGLLLLGAGGAAAQTVQHPTEPDKGAPAPAGQRAPAASAAPVTVISPCPTQLAVALKVVDNTRIVRDYYEAQLAQAQVELAQTQARLRVWQNTVEAAP